jgi:hypothetical protein
MEQLVPPDFMKKDDEFGLEKPSFISPKGVKNDGISTTAKFSVSNFPSFFVYFGDG